MAAKGKFFHLMVGVGSHPPFEQNHVLCLEIRLIGHAVPYGPRRAALRRREAACNGDVWPAYKKGRVFAIVNKRPELCFPVGHNVQNGDHGFYIDIKRMTEISKTL